ncbi:MAG TPA: ribbon-helix-helix protein, CopG family [Acidimicrobiales bacterium]|nr:ribbon-helix-helix protein, CopG family [Acidimicrobiales bacterium]
MTLDDDVAAAVESLRRQEGTGVSEAVNRLIRAGLARRPTRVTYRHRTSDLGLKIDVTNVGEVLDLLDER